MYPLNITFIIIIKHIVYIYTGYSRIIIIIKTYSIHIYKVRTYNNDKTYSLHIYRVRTYYNNNTYSIHIYWVRTYIIRLQYLGDPDTLLLPITLSNVFPSTSLPVQALPFLYKSRKIPEGYLSSNVSRIERKRERKIWGKIDKERKIKGK